MSEKGGWGGGGGGEELFMFCIPESLLDHRRCIIIFREEKCFVSTKITSDDQSLFQKTCIPNAFFSSAVPRTPSTQRDSFKGFNFHLQC